MSTPSTPYEYAHCYLSAGLNVIPIRRDGSKAPTCDWKRYQSEIVRASEAAGWWVRPEPPGLAVVCGHISCGTELLDFDSGEVLGPWRTLVEEECPDLVSRLCLVRTPRQPSGWHVWLRTYDHVIPGNTKLAVDPSRPAGERTLIETRGEGGYALVPGSPPECHPTGQLYRHEGGPPLWELRPISAEEREVLIRCARSFDRDVRETPCTPAGVVAAAEQALARAERSLAGVLLPGQDFDVRGPDWGEILRPHGWELASTSGNERRWRRPGKGKGWSATTGHCRSSDGADLLRVFSTNAQPFEDGHAYGKFRALALLDCGGDYSEAARRLQALGFGERKPSTPVLSSLPLRPEVVLEALARADRDALRALLRKILWGDGHG